MEDEMSRNQAEMDLLFEEVRHVSYAAVSWQYVAELAFIASDVAQ